MLVFSEWLNANEVRRYPLHDRASGELPDNILVDARLWVPKSAGHAVFVSSVGITSGLVTITFLAAPSSPFVLGTGASTPFSPLAVVRVSRPVTKFVNVAVEALYPGVGGWVAFGEGAATLEEGFWRFSSPAEAQLNERCVTLYDDAAVSGISKAGVSQVLGGLITLRGESGVLKTYKATREIEGTDHEVAVVAMDLSEDRVSRLQNYTGTCGGRPHVNTCRKRVITRINNVEPDDDGNIELVFEGEMTVGDVQRGMVVDFPTGLDDVCPEAVDDEVPYPPPGGPPSPTPPTPPPDPSGSSACSSSDPSLSPGYCEDFESGTAEEMEVIEDTASFTVLDVTGRGKRYVSGTSLTGQTSVNVFRDLDANDQYTVEGIIRPRNADGNGFLVAGFKNTNSFMFAGITLRDGGRFFVGRKVYSGGNWPNGLGQGYTFHLDWAPNWDTPEETDYRVTFAIYSEDLAEVKVAWNDGTTDREQTQLVVLPSQFNAEGRAGLGVVGSKTEFDEYGINCDEYPSSSSSGP